MPKYGISLKIDVKKIDKERLFKGQKGTYLDMTFFLDTENESQYGDNGTITQSVSKEEKDNGVKLPIMGNGKIFWTDGGQQQGYQQPRQNQGQQSRQPIPDDDIPF
jgi:hypothetical protein